MKNWWASILRFTFLYQTLIRTYVKLIYRLSLKIQTSFKQIKEKTKHAAIWDSVSKMRFAISLVKVTCCVLWKESLVCTKSSNANYNDSQLDTVCPPMHMHEFARVHSTLLFTQPRSRGWLLNRFALHRIYFLLPTGKKNPANSGRQEDFGFPISV